MMPIPPFDLSYAVLDIRKAALELDWRPNTDLESMIEKMTGFGLRSTSNSLG